MGAAHLAYESRNPSRPVAADTGSGSVATLDRGGAPLRATSPANGTARADALRGGASHEAPAEDDGSLGAPSRSEGLVSAAISVVVTMCIALDFVGDIVRGNESAVHLTGMAIGTALSATGVALMMRMLRASGARAERLATALDGTRADLRRWREQAGQMFAGLGALIDKQFSEWDLSPAEREVALLLLKGLSLKEIAVVRRASEPTVRQQAQAVYRKADLTGRAELSAFFLEDLLQPLEGHGAAESPPQKSA